MQNNILNKKLFFFKNEEYLQNYVQLQKAVAFEQGDVVIADAKTKEYRICTDEEYKQGKFFIRDDKKIYTNLFEITKDIHFVKGYLKTENGDVNIDEYLISSMKKQGNKKLYYALQQYFGCFPLVWGNPMKRFEEPIEMALKHNPAELVGL